MELGEVLEEGLAHELLQGADLHLPGVAKAHVILDEPADLLALAIREPESAADLLRHLGAGLLVGGETLRVRGAGLADVVKERRKDEFPARLTRPLKTPQRVDEHVALRVPVLALSDAFHLDDLGQDVPE